MFYYRLVVFQQNKPIFEEVQ